MLIKTKKKLPNKDRKNTSKEKILETTISQIEKNYGKGSVMRMKTNGSIEKIDSIPTGSISLDLGLGIGGVPKGRIIEIFGAESAGKSTLALSIVAESQKQGGTAAFIDDEHALDPIYSKTIGVNIEDLLISQPDSAEQALEITDYLVRSGAIDVIVLDSVAALVPNTELEGEMGELQIGLQARLMSQALRKLTGSINRTNTVAIFINQLREKVGVVFGNPETTPGGRALKFYSSVRIDLRRIEPIKIGTELIGNRIRARIVKNKVAPPFKKAEIDILFSEGISKEGSLLDLGVEKNIITKSGSFYSYEQTKLGHGREASRTFLKDNIEISQKIDQQIRQSSEL